MGKEKEITDSDFKDLKPQNRRRRKKLPKPWGKFERYFIFVAFFLTVATAGILSLSAREWKLPNFPRISLPNLSELNPLREKTIIVGNKGVMISQEKIEKTRSEFRLLTDNYSGIYAFYLYDINGGYYYGENHREIMQAASLIKLPVMELAFRKIESGELKEEDILPMLEAMGKKSDNHAFLDMVDLLGSQNIEKEIKELGMLSTSLSRNQTSPEDVGIFFKKLYKREMLNEKNTQLFLGYLTDTNFENWLRPGIPEDVVLSHKYGRETHSVSDGGVIISSRPLVMVIMTDGVIESEADDLFPKLSELLYNKHTNEITN